MSENNMEQITQARKSEADDDGISLISLAATLWKRKWLILIVTAAAAVISVGYAMKKPNLYTASAMVLPISGSSSTSLISQYANLASIAGVSLPSGGSSSSVTKIQAIINSRTFSENLVGRLGLVPQLVEHPERIKIGTPISGAVRMLRGILSVSVDTKSTLMTITAKTKSPTLSSTIANGALDLIQEELANRALSSSGKNIALLQLQTTDQEKKVQAAQEKLEAYQRRYKLVSPQAQSSAGFQIYQGLVQQKMTLELEIQRLESALSSDNPKLVSAQSQLAALKAQMASFEKTGGGVGPSVNDTPAALMEYANITAELDLNTKIYSTLISSLETLKLQDDAEKVFVEVIDRAIPPEMRSEPSRARICVIGTLAGGVLSILLVFIMDAVRKLVADPEVRAKFSSPETKREKTDSKNSRMNK
jgi:uncharacterized protein involved in exopolysaccharide biosynthesis